MEHIKICSEIGNKNIGKFDYDLIWTLCKCKCPSVRLYIFEDIKTLYLLIRNSFKSDQECTKLFLKEIEDAIEAINQIFRSMAELTSACFKEYSVKSDDMIKYGLQNDYVYQKQGFTQQKIANASSGQSNGFAEKIIETKTLFAYLPSKGSLRMDKIAYAIITALNEQWSLQ